PGVYLIRVSHAGYSTAEVLQRLLITRAGEVVPVPVGLEPVGPAPIATPTPTVAPTATPITPPLSVEETEIRAQLSAKDGRRSGSFTDVDLVTLPLGSVTLTRTFDELALLLPGVAPPPQTIGHGSGPGVGAGVGSA